MLRRDSLSGNAVIKLLSYLIPGRLDETLCSLAWKEV